MRQAGPVDPAFNYVRNITTSSSVIANNARFRIVGIAAALTDITEELTLKISDMFRDGVDVTSDGSTVSQVGYYWCDGWCYW